MVPEGLYREDIIIDKEIILVAAKSQTVTIEGIVRCRGGTSISGFSITNNNEGDAAMIVERGTFFEHFY